MSYRFLIETYETERLKTLSVWSMFRDGDLEGPPSSDRPARPEHPGAAGTPERQ